MSRAARIVTRAALVGCGAAATSSVLGRLARRSNRRRATPAGAAELPPDDLTVLTDDGASLAVTVEGTGARGTVVLVHGWTGDRTVWDLVAERLVAQGCRVVRHDVRGHGRSTVGTNGLGMDRLVADLSAVLHAADVHDVVLVGHSLGALTSIAFLSAAGAANDSDRVGSCVLVSASVPDPNLHGAALGVAEWAMRSPGLEWLIARERAGLRLMDPFAGPGRDQDQLRAQRATFLATPGAVRAGLLSTIQSDLRPRVAHVSTPTALVVGADDQLAAPDRAGELARLLRAELVEVPDHGHNLPYEVPDLLVDLIVRGSRTRS